jgi:hypothetical protein
MKRFIVVSVSLVALLAAAPVATALSGSGGTQGAVGSGAATASGGASASAQVTTPDPSPVVAHGAATLNAEASAIQSTATSVVVRTHDAAHAAGTRGRDAAEHAELDVSLRGTAPASGSSVAVGSCGSRTVNASAPIEATGAASLDVRR